jgi:hypothetical protein
MEATTKDRSATGALEAPAIETQLRSSKLISVVALMAIIVGIGSMLGGIAGATYTYQQAAVENIVTPDDARIPGADVRGPLTMWAQSDIITHHQLERTEGLRYAEMERMVPQVDEAGEVVLGEDGEPVMVPNQERLSWIDATSLTTVLGVGIMAYALAAFAIVVGATLLGLGLVLMRLRRTALGLI